jgi:hypothetical protein
MLLSQLGSLLSPPPAGKKEVLYRFCEPTVACRRLGYVDLVVDLVVDHVVDLVVDLVVNLVEMLI